MKILMVGLGGIGQRHLRNLRTLLGSRAEISAYRVRGQSAVLTDGLQVETGSSLEEKFRLRVFHDLDEALNDGPRAVVVCNPSSLHLPVALQAARAGCHLFLEKPVAHCLEGTEALAALVEKNNLQVLVGYQLRFHPCIRHVGSLLRQNAVGGLIGVQAEIGEYLPGWHTYEDYRQMYAARRDLGGGVVLSQIHEMDYLYSFFGLPRSLYAIGGKLSSLEIDVEDTASVLMDYAGMAVSLHMDYIQRPPCRTLKIIGNEGILWADLRQPLVRRYDAHGALCEETVFGDFERNRLFLDEMAHFLACVEGREKPVVSLRDGLQSLRMALAVKESLGSRLPVELS